MDGARITSAAARVIPLVCCWALPAEAGKLSDLREETGSSSGSSSSPDDDDDGSFILDLFFSDEDDPHYHSHPGSDIGDSATVASTLSQPWFYPLYPYRGSVSGNLARRRFTLDTPVASTCSREDGACQANESVVACVDGTCYSEAAIVDAPPDGHQAQVAQLQSVRGQLQLDSGNTVDGLWRGTVQGTVDHHRGLGLDAKLTLWIEPQPTQAADSTLLGDVGLRFALFNSPAFQLRLGVGPRFQADALSQTAGFNGSLSAELYPFQPIVVRLDADTGNLGKAFVYEAQASLGVLLMRTEVMAGLSTLHVGDVAFDSAFAGIRFHL